MMRKFTAISLFSGAGGMDIGVSQADFSIQCCIEIDKYCCQTLNENIRREGKNTNVYEVDIRDVEPHDILKDLGASPNELDLLFGGPPCQAFSQIGKQRSLFDERGLLLFQMVRFAKVIRPRVIMIEQVKGLLSAKGIDAKRGSVFTQFIKDLEDIGYSPKWHVLLAADYGVPQMRERVFIVATQGANTFAFPQKTHFQGGMGLLCGRPYMTVGEALSGLGEPVKKADTPTIPDDSHYDVTPKRDRERIHGVPEGKNLSSQTHLPKEQLCGLTPKDTTKFLRMARSRPANTLRCGEIFYHPVEDRYLTPREYMRIHGYPDSYVLSGPIRGRCGSVKALDQHRQVANSVPPPLAKVMAEQIKEQILCQKSLSCLGSPQLIPAM